MIKFNIPAIVGSEQQYILESLASGTLSGDGHFTKLCHEWFEQHLGGSKTLLTPNCTQALEMAAILLNVKPGDEIIMPSYTFVSTANAFALRGAKIVFVDIRPDTMNIDEELIEEAINEKTKAIVVVHYAGVACEMDKIMEVAERNNVFVIEDAAQGMMSKYKGRSLGTIGHFGAYSFHETKNYTSAGEGGLLIINDQQYFSRAEIIREKGTNRNQFFRGMVDKYSWVDIGSSYLPSDLQAAFLYGQLESSELINSKRLEIWNFYQEELQSIESQGIIDLPVIPKECDHNAHMFYIKLKDISEREKFIEYMKNNGVMAVFHYVPLHSSKAGIKLGAFFGNDIATTRESERLVRLPIYFNMNKQQLEKIVELVKSYFDER